MAQPTRSSPTGNDGVYFNEPWQIYMGGKGSQPVGNEFQYPPTVPPAYVPVVGVEGSPGMAPMQQAYAAPPPMAPNMINNLIMLQANIQLIMNAQGQGHS